MRRPTTHSTLDTTASTSRATSRGHLPHCPSGHVVYRHGYQRLQLRVGQGAVAAWVGSAQHVAGREALPLALHACSAGVRQVIALVQQCQNTPAQGRGKGPRGRAKAPELDPPRRVYHPSRCRMRRWCLIRYGAQRTSLGGEKTPECSLLCTSQRGREPACSALFGLGKSSQRELATARRSPHYRPGRGLWVRLRESVSGACRLVLLCAWSTTFDRAGLSAIIQPTCEERAYWPVPARLCSAMMHSPR